MSETNERAIMEHNFNFLKPEADRVCAGEPMRPKELESIMQRYEGASDEMKKEIVAFLSAFGDTCKKIAKFGYGIEI